LNENYGEFINFAEIWGIYKFSGSTGNMQYASLA